MATNPLNPATNDVATADGSVPDVPGTPSPTVTFYQQLASDFMKELDDIARLIPKLELSGNVPTANFVRAFRSVPIAFLATVVASVEQRPELQNLGKLDVVVGRSKLQYLDAFRPVSDKTAALEMSLKFAFESHKAVLAAAALPSCRRKEV